MPRQRISKAQTLLLLALCVLLPRYAWAGMPSILLTDIATARLQSLSFFLFIFLVSTLVIQQVWKFLRKDFPRMPTLSYSRALAMVFLWAVAFEIALLMISGARELLTPGAWEKVGYTHKLSTTQTK